MNERRSINQAPSCANSGEPGLLSVEQAEQRIFDLVRPRHCPERVDIRRALGRTLASDVHSTINVPSHTNSAMDGYAICAADIPAEGTVQLALAGTALAGRPFHGRVKPGQIAIVAGKCLQTADLGLLSA